MRWMLLGAAALAAAAVPVTPAAAQLARDGGTNVGAAPGSLSGGFVGGGDRGDRRTRTTVVLGYGYGGEWARYNNRSFEPDSYNDWWHERPERSYPRWLQNNENCERRWWGGGTWRC